MVSDVSDDDIRAFLHGNEGEYPSQVSLIRAAVRRLWPEGASAESAERVVRVCLSMTASGAPKAPFPILSTAQAA